MKTCFIYKIRYFKHMHDLLSVKRLFNLHIYIYWTKISSLKSFHFIILIEKCSFFPSPLRKYCAHATLQELQLHLGVLQQHAALIGGPNATSCPICHKLFLGGEALMEHMKHTHKDPNASGVASKYPTLVKKKGIYCFVRILVSFSF